MTGTTLSFKQMCERFDVTPRTLRYYEYIELLQPEKDGRSRHFGPREIARMTLILRGRRWGFSLEEIRQWLQIYENEGSRAQMETLVEHADRQIRHLEKEIEQYQSALDELRETRDRVTRELGGKT